MDKRIGEVAELTGLTLRTLRHWDELNIVSPSGRTRGGYRLYSSGDIALIQRAMIYRATGMSLDQVREVIHGGESLDHLLRQRDLLVARQDHLQSMMTMIDTLIEDTMMKKLSPEDIAQVMGDADVAAYAEEAEEQWGGTTEWAVSQERAASRSATDWADLRAQTDTVEQAMVEAMGRGVEPGSEEAHRLADQHRKLLSAHFPVSISQHVLIARGYTADPRFTEYYEKRAVGLAAYLRSVIEARAVAEGIDPDAAEWE